MPPEGLPLERELELTGPRLGWCEWPGRRGPLVCLPDAQQTNASWWRTLAGAVAPEWRVLLIAPAGGSAPARVVQLVTLFKAFGFERTPVVVGSRDASLVALLLAAWFSDRVGGLVLIDSQAALLRGTRRLSLRLAALERAVRCPRLTVRGGPAVVDAITAFLQSAPCC